jgi:hypothetical protein
MDRNPATSQQYFVHRISHHDPLLIVQLGIWHVSPLKFFHPSATYHRAEQPVISLYRSFHELQL